MANKHFIICLVLGLFLQSNFVNAQDQHAFQWRCASKDNGNMLLFDALPLEDHGYVCGGIAEYPTGSNVYFPFMFRLDCKGNVLWAKIFNEATESANNIAGRVLRLSATDFGLVANVGFFFSSPYNDIFVARVSADGAPVWTRRIGGGTNNQDVAQSAIVTNDGNIVIAGQTSSFGTDANTMNQYTDQYFLKISNTGNILWTRTLGNHNKNDRAFDIVETADGSLVSAGSYIHTGETFYANLLKMDKNGNIQWNKGFGEGTAPQANHAYGLLRCSDNGFLLTGSSTNEQTNFLGYGDFLAIKTDANGTAQWTRVVAGGFPNSFENASNSLEKSNGDFIISCATNSYPSNGIVANKHIVITLSGAGDLKGTKAYNLGGSHYPRLKYDQPEGGYLLAGFSNWSSYGGDGLRFDPILINLNDQMTTACFNADFSAFTTIYNPDFDKDDLPGTSNIGGTVVSDLMNVSNYEVVFENVCETNGFSSCSDASSVFTLLNVEGFEIFPNPARANAPVSLRWDAGEIESIAIFDVQGRFIREYRPVAGMHNVDAEFPHAGVYLAKLISAGKSRTEQIVVVE